MLLYWRAGLVRLHQKEQVQDDMQTTAHSTTIEQMLESADHLIEKHRGDPAAFDHYADTPHVPAGWILYSAQYELGGMRQPWKVELMDTTRPFQDGSIVVAQHSESLDAALREASRKALARPMGGN